MNFTFLNSNCTERSLAISQDNPGAPNIGLGIGLQDTPLGNKGVRLLMSNMDMPHPARSSMQDIKYSIKDCDRSQVVKHKLIQHSNKIQEHSEYKRVTKTKSGCRKGQLVDTSPSTSGLRNDHTY